MLSTITNLLVRCVRRIQALEDAIVGRLVVGTVLVILTAIAVGVLKGPFIGRQDSQEFTIHTQAGEVLSPRLTDGTVMQIGQSSDVHVEITDRGRVIELLRGKIELNSRADLRRPLVIRAPNVRLTSAYGGAVSISTDKTHGTDITVLPGDGRSVELWYRSARDLRSSAPAQKGFQRVVLRRGQNVLIRSTGELVLGRGKFAYQSGDLPENLVVFRDARLADVLGSFNRFYKVAVRLDVQDIAGTRIDGSFDVYDRPSLIEYLIESYGVTASTLADGTVVLGRARPAVGRKI